MRHQRERKPALNLTLLSIALAVSCNAWAQDSGRGVDLHFGNALDPSGMAAYGCDPDGGTWLSSIRRSTPTGFLYACVPQYPEMKEDGEGGKYRGMLSIGYINASGDTQNMMWRRFSNWDGGAYLGGDWHFEKPADGSYFDLRFSHLDQDSQYARAVFGRAGKFRVQAFARSQSNVTSGNARSIWDGVGSNHLTLKDGLLPARSTSAQVAAMSAAQPERMLTVVREKQGVGLNYYINTQWTAFANVSHEARTGARPFGGPFFFNFPFPDNGGVYETPRPIDDSTVNLNGGARFVGNVWRMEFMYSGSFFRHANRSFDYEVPYALRPVVPGLASPPLTTGQFAYEPDNNHNQLRASFTRKIAWNGQFSLTASGGTMRQNDQLLAPMPESCQGQFGIPIPGALFDCANWNTTDALSRKRADLSINSQLVDARVVLQPNDRLTWRGNIKYQREDYAGTYWAYNPLTGQWGYVAENGSQGSVVPGEAGIWSPSSPSVFTRIRNLPLDRELREASFGADWRLSDANTVGASYTFDRTERNHREVATSKDHVFKLNWTNRGLDWFTFRANYVHLRRTGSEYEYDPYEFTFSSALPGYVPPVGGDTAHTASALRKYDVGDRTQNKADLMATFSLPRNMSIYASVRGDWNDYGAELGRQRYDTLGASLQWEWQPTPATTASAWYGYDRSALEIANVNDAALTPDPTLGGPTYPIANRWWMQDRQRNHYAGINLLQRVGKVTFNADWNWAYSRGMTSYRYNSPGALANPATAPLLTGQFPDMIYRTNSLSVGMHVPLNRSLSVRLFDTYQRGRVFDWHYLGFENGQIFDHRVYTDGGPEDFSVNMVGALLEVRL